MPPPFATAAGQQQNANRFGACLCQQLGLWLGKQLGQKFQQRGNACLCVVEHDQRWAVSLGQFAHQTGAVLRPQGVA